MRAGRLSHRIKLQSPSTGLDATGAPNSTWNTYATVWAKREEPRGSEQFEETGEVATHETRWTIRHRTDVSVTDRVVPTRSTADQYDIISASDPDGRREQLVLSTERIQ